MSENFRIRNQQAIHFITSTVIHWIPVFGRDDYFRVLVDSFKYCIADRGLSIHAYVLMPNHFHAICSQISGDLSGVIRDLKRFTSREIVKMVEHDGKDIWLRAMQRAGGNQAAASLWDLAFHPVEITSEAFWKQKCEYIHNNPVRTGWIEDPCAWKYSSAAAYLQDGVSPIPVERIGS